MTRVVLALLAGALACGATCIGLNALLYDGIFSLRT